MQRYLASAIAVLTIMTTHVGAQPRPIAKDAKRELDRGMERFAAHDYVAAITAFDTGYAIDPHPDFLYAKAQAQRLGGDCRGAVASYTAFLAASPPASEAELARNNIARCDQVLAASKPEPKPELEPTPAPPLRLDPAPQLSPQAQPDPPDPTIDRQPRHDPWWTDRAGAALVASGVVSLGIAAGFAVKASAHAADTASDDLLLDWQASRDAWRRDRTIATIGLGLGAALIIGGGVRFAWASSRDRPPTLTPTVSRTGAIVTLEGRW